MYLCVVVRITALTGMITTLHMCEIGGNQSMFFFSLCNWHTWDTLQSNYQTQQYYSSLINWKKTGHISLRDSRSIYTCECHFNELHGHFYGKTHPSYKREERRKERMLPPPLLLCWKYLFVPLFVPIIPPPDDQKEENIIKFQLLINVPSLA